MMPGPDGTSAIPMQPQQLGDGDILGDGIEGAPSEDNAKNPANLATEQANMDAESAIRNKLVTDAYGTKLPQRRAVDRE